MAYYLGQVEERNGEYEYHITFRFQAEDPDKRMNEIAANWYERDDDEEPEVDGDYYVFNGGEIYARQHQYREIPLAAYHSLDGFIVDLS